MKLLYTVHEHRAKRAGLHYDLRLQKKNDVYSFALPKAKLPDENTVFLAIKTHTDYDDLSSLRFHGSISDGKYGAGNLIILETGKYEILEWLEDSSKIIFYVPSQFNNQILKGKYYLVKTGNGDNNYIFGKSKK